MFRLFFLISLLPLFVACGGGGGSDNNSGSLSTNPPPASGGQYSLGGTVHGLDGSLTIANGNDQLILTAEGNFTFSVLLNTGDLYSVKVVSSPDNQICEVLNGRGFITADTNNVVIECVSIVPVSVIIDRPDGFSLSDLRLISNYEALGGISEPALIGGGNSETLTVSNNSFISLLNENGSSTNFDNVVYLSFIDNVSKNNFVIDSVTTAISLVLLEPTIASTIQDRNLSVSMIIDGLITALDTPIAPNPISPLDDLSAQIQALADAGMTLTNNANSLTALQAALDVAIAHFQTIPLVPPELMAGSVTSQEAGISFDFSQITSGIQINTYNHRNRFVSIESSDFASVELAPYAMESFLISNGVIDLQTIFNINIIGPGENGSLNSQNSNSLYTTSAISDLSLYLFPSIKSVLGLSNAFAFDLNQCFSEAVTNQLVNAMSQDTTARNELNNANYYRAFTAMYNRGLSNILQMLSDSITNNTTRLIVDCPEFSIGLITERRKTAAIENISTLLTLVNDVYTNPLGLIGLFDGSDVTHLINAINQSSVDSTWSLGRQYSVTGGGINSDFAIGSDSVTKEPVEEQGERLEITAGASIQYPRVLLNLNDASQNAASNAYSFDDLNGVEVCQALFEVQNPDNSIDRYCTWTDGLLVANPQTGQIIKSSVNDSVSKYSFAFDAIRFDCAGITANCPTINVSGELLYSR